MSVESIIRGTPRDLSDGFTVLRVLPHAKRRMVGPFVFVDHFGPAVLPAGSAFDVRPHPHIGLATVTYLFDGAILHRDSLGNVQRIEPGAVNWMTAGRGIVHSERTPPDLRGQPLPMHGMQIWVALPLDLEDASPSFLHVAASELPQIELPSARVRVIVGHAFGARAPVATFSDTVYAALHMDGGAGITIPLEHAERAIYVADGRVQIDGTSVQPGELAVLAPGVEAHVIAQAPSHCMLLGGAPVGERLVWWNFVASSRERIEAAKAEWQNYALEGSAQFGRVAGDDEHIPLPPR